ncbi:MAG: homocysteine S-methyltransferase family protein [Candidatus Eisenbacteria bacterium]
MTHDELRGFLGDRVVIFEGGMGTTLQEALPRVRTLELINVEHADELLGVHRAYASVADVICTNTFGGTSVKLGAAGLADRAAELNAAGARLAREAAGDGTLVAGDIGPTGRLVEPLGDLGFWEAYDSFRAQAEVLAESGVDFILIETMSDLKEAKAALLAAREATGLPVVITMTFDETFVTPTGTDAATAANVLTSMGAFAVGANCSTGPEHMVEVVGRMAQVTSAPILVQPNAGVPELVDGRTVFRLGSEEFADYGGKFVTAGASMVGGCCGTTPWHIAALRSRLAGARPVSRDVPPALRLSSRMRTVEIGRNLPFTVVGERINPTNREDLTAEVLAGGTEIILNDARAQYVAGAHVLDVNIGVPGVDEALAMPRAALALENSIAAPLSIDSMNPAAFEGALVALAGKPLLNSVTGAPDKMEAVLPLAARFGAGVVCLAMDDTGIKSTAEGRIAVLARIVEAADRHGVKRENLIADCLTLAVSAEQERVPETLRAVGLARSELGLPTILGVSNVSHGLPDRGVLNASFLAMAMERGLDAAIMNPLDGAMMSTLRASSVLTLRDRGSAGYIREHMKRRKKKAQAEPVAADSITARMERAVVDGNVGDIGSMVDEALAFGLEPRAINDGILIPALEEVGRRFERRDCFLPQMMLAAETVEKAFAKLKPLFPKDEQAAGRATVVMATVEGDVHDIGKNILASMLENHGYRVVDLGKNVPAERIVAAARDERADAVALSALMTTTIGQMPLVIGRLRDEGLSCKVMVGGAVVTQRYASSIGADGYAKDAARAVTALKELLQE